MSIKEISWAAGARYKGDPEKAYHELNEIKERNGGVLDTEAVVEAARDPKLEIHKAVFDCDPAEASERYYRHTAGILIRTIIVTYHEQPEVQVRAFQAVAAKPGNTLARVYRTTHEALENEDHRSFMLEVAKKDLEAFMKKYSNLRELSGLITAINDLLSL